MQVSSFFKNNNRSRLQPISKKEMAAVTGGHKGLALTSTQLSKDEIRLTVDEVGGGQV